jgi:hypothetical protein
LIGLRQAHRDLSMSTSHLAGSTVVQLRDAQERLAAADARVAALEQDNRHLRAQLSEERALNARPDTGNAPSPTETDAHDVFTRELRQQTVELAKRLSDVERMSMERASTMRRQYEAHIDSLEMELRRVKLGGRNVALPATAVPSPHPTTARAPTVNSPVSTMAGRTPDTRRNLL